MKRITDTVLASPESTLNVLRPNGVVYQADAAPADQRQPPPDDDGKLLLGLEGAGQVGWWHRVITEDLEGARGEYAQFLAGGAPLDIEYRIRQPDGSERWIRDRARVVARDAQGVPTVLVGVIDDVTHRNSVRRRAQEASAKYRQLFNSIDAGFCVIEMIFDHAGAAIDYLFLEVNAAFPGVTGIEDGVGRRMREIAPNHEQDWFDIYGQIATTREAKRFEHSAVELGFYYDVYAFPVGHPSLNQVGVLFTDISDRKRSEEALREDGRKKTEFIAMLAHELRNPLATITSGVQAMKLGSQSVAMHPAAPMVDRQIAQMTQLLDDLLDINRITLGKVQLRPRRMDLVKLIGQVCDTFQPFYAEQQLTLLCSVPPRAIWAQVDATRLMQVLGNLLSNAAKFSHAGGRVRLKLVEDGDLARITVRDKGIGIESTKLEHIFELFAQVDSERHASFGGLGVGVALARELVEMHGGKIRADSAGPEQGSTFTVTLPLEQQVANPVQTATLAATLADAATGHSVLVIDDNRDAADSISMVMEALGHSVTTRYSGPDGLLAVDAARPDIVFSDIGMPGMDGHEVCRQLRARPDGAALRIVALTGWGASEDRDQTAQAGFDYHLVKPVTMAKLREALAAILG